MNKKDLGYRQGGIHSVDSFPAPRAYPPSLYYTRLWLERLIERKGHVTKADIAALLLTLQDVK